jgi:hypothetical protein
MTISAGSQASALALPHSWPDVEALAAGIV